MAELQGDLKERIKKRIEKTHTDLKLKKNISSYREVY